MGVYIQKLRYDIGDVVKFKCHTLTYTGTIVGIRNGGIWGKRFENETFYTIEVSFTNKDNSVTPVRYSVTIESIIGINCNRVYYTVV